MAIAYRDATSAVATSTNTQTVAKPAGLANGDVLLIIGTARASVDVSSGPSGGINIPAATGTSGSTTASNVRVASYYKVITDAGSEPADYTITWTGNCFGTIAALAFSGCDTVSPINIAGLAGDTDNGATVSSPAVTTTVDDTMLVEGVAMCVSSGLTSWAPTNATEAEDPGVVTGTNRVAMAVGYEAHASAGASTAEVWTATATTTALALGYTIALQEPQLTANAGADQEATPGELVILAGSATGGATEFLWTQTGGTPTVILADADTDEASFYAPVQLGTLTFTLTAGDGVLEDTDTMTVTITDPAADLIQFRVRADGAWV